MASFNGLPVRLAIHSPSLLLLPSAFPLYALPSSRLGLPRSSNPTILSGLDGSERGKARLASSQSVCPMSGRQEELFVKGELCPHIDASFLEIGIMLPLGVLFPWIET